MYSTAAALDKNDHHRDLLHYLVAQVACAQLLTQTQVSSNQENQVVAISSPAGGGPACIFMQLVQGRAYSWQAAAGLTTARRSPAILWGGTLSTNRRWSSAGAVNPFNSVDLSVALSSVDLGLSSADLAAAVELF